MEALEGLLTSSLLTSNFNTSNFRIKKLEVRSRKSIKISNDQELIQSDPISCPQNQKGNN